MRILTLAAVVILLPLTACAGPVEARPQFVAESPVPSSQPVPQPRIETGDGSGIVDPSGDVIGTGVRDGAGHEYVIYGITGERIADFAPFGFGIGVRKQPGLVAEDVVINEDGEPEATPGFHVMQGETEMGDGSTRPAFGYYVGDPATISVSDDGKPLTAKLAKWTHDRQVTVFWFDPAQTRDASTWRGLSAYDAAGAKLPAGHLKVLAP